MKHIVTIIAVGLALAGVLSVRPANALSARTFVSPTGNDANDCSLTAPCRHLQAALAATISGGEIAVLGTAGYNGSATVTIDKAISIVNPGGFEAGIFVASGGAGILINAGANDAVTLRGLTINGGGTGYNGIVFNSGKSLTVDNCVVQNFHNDVGVSGNGILIQPASGTMQFAITNTNVSNNEYVGVLYQPPSGSPDANFVIDHVTAIGNTNGIYLSTNAAAGGRTSAAISNSIASNGNTGILANNGPGTMSISIDNVTASGNAFYGIEAQTTTNVVVGRSTIANNSNFGIANLTSPNTFYTHQNNQIHLNNSDIGGAALLPKSFQ